MQTPKYLKSQQGVVGLVILAIVVVVVIGAAALYVYKVRTGQTASITTTTVERPKVATPVEVKKDVDAAAADEAGQKADAESLDDLNFSDSDLQ